MLQTITWKIGGEAGFGIMASGTMMARAFTRAGYHIFATNEYPSLIRGGHNLVTVRIGTEKFESMNREVHILVALNRETVELHKQELNEGALVIYDPKDSDFSLADFPKKIELLPIPFGEIVIKLQGEPVMRNTVALGATMALLGVDFEKLAVVIKDQFKKKSEVIVKHNLDLAQAGYIYIKEYFGKLTQMYLAPSQFTEKELVINASEAVGIGAVAAGLKFAAIYPMTPINSLITFLADHAKELNLVYKQPEDEIAGINMAIGASLAGARSMVATSGGGFALMVEGLSLAGMVEVPLVIDMGMRAGPATGMPTWTEQGELQFLIRAGHGEFARIILAPADAAEAYSLTIDAFNLADKFQVPVFVLTDKYINESQWCVPLSHFQKKASIDRGKLVKPEQLVKGEFKRYALNEPDGISPRSVPGMPGGFYLANSYEHDETGFVTEDAGQRTAMADKRLKKLKAIETIARAPNIYGDQAAELAFVSWGSTKGPILEAIRLLAQKGQKAKLIHFNWVYPFPIKATEMLKSGRLIVVEQNSTGQLAVLIREQTGIEIKEKLLKYDGRPFYPEEIVERIAKL